MTADARTDAAIRVLIADGQALVRGGYRALLASDERIALAGEAASCAQAVAVARDTRPDVALLDLGLPDPDELGPAAQIPSHPAFAGVAVLVVAARESDERVYSALRAGAVGVLPKDSEPAELIRAVHLLARGQALLPAQTVQRIIHEIPLRPLHEVHLTSHLEELTEREREVVALVAMGLSNEEIATQLMISPATAKTHVSRAMLKLHARHRAQLVTLAFETGLASPRSSRQHRDDRPLAAAGP